MGGIRPSVVTNGHEPRALAKSGLPPVSVNSHLHLGTAEPTMAVREDWENGPTHLPFHTVTFFVVKPFSLFRYGKRKSRDLPSTCNPVRTSKLV
jgi:hypothetical protein